MFRKLVSLSKMSPTQFHRLLPEGKEESENGLRMMGKGRDKATAMRSFDKAMKANGVPEKVTMDGRSASGEQR